MRIFLLCTLAWLALPGISGADTLRVATFNVELYRKGPGLLLRDILGDKDPQPEAVARIIAHVDPDVILLTRFDFDLTGAALSAFAELLARSGTAYPYSFALRPNSGWQSGQDLDGDGRLGGPADAQGFGWFSGQSGMAILSKFPIPADQARDFSDLLWRDLPGAALPRSGPKPFLSPDAEAVQRLSSVGHWDVPITLPDGTALHLMAFHATPPVFDGEEDRNGLRNRDELRFWSLYLDGALDPPAESAPFVLLGNTNLDPEKGEGLRDTMADLLFHPSLQDPAPRSEGGTESGAPTDTVDWSKSDEPGNMRVQYVLPSRDLEIAGSGVFWPAKEDPEAALLGDEGRAASRHRLVWVDIVMPRSSPREP